MQSTVWCGQDSVLIYFFSARLATPSKGESMWQSTSIVDGSLLRIRPTRHAARWTGRKAARGQQKTGRRQQRAYTSIYSSVTRAKTSNAAHETPLFVFEPGGEVGRMASSCVPEPQEAS